MKIGDKVYIRGYVDEIRKDTVIVRNDGGYFGTVVSEIIKRKKGKWMVTPIYIKCSECGESFMLIPQNYCPNCGAQMERGEQE